MTDIIDRPSTASYPMAGRTLPFRAIGGSLHINSLATFVPDGRMTVPSAVASGQYPAEQAARDGYESVAISERPTIEMAETVAVAAAKAAGLSGTDLSVVTYSSIHDNGVGGFWQPAAYVQRKLQASDALSFSVQHGCNGLMLAIMANASLLPLKGGAGIAVAADRFSGSAFNRWNSDAGIAYGDAAVALCLSQRQGFARILYMDVDSVPELEEMHRGDPDDRSNLWDVTIRKKRFLSLHGKPAFFDRMKAAVMRLKTRLAVAGLAGPESYEAVVLPFVGESISATLYEPEFSYLGRRTLTDFGKTVGHTGPSDQMIGLARYLADETARAGDRVLLLGVGAGFSLSLAVVEINRAPVHHSATAETFR